MLTPTPLGIGAVIRANSDILMTGTVVRANSDAPGIGTVVHDNLKAPRTGPADHTIFDDSQTGIADHVIINTPLTGAFTQPFWLRFADNLVYVVQSVTDGIQILNRARQLLEIAGHTLKGEDGHPVDLRMGEAQLLGFTLSLRDNRLQLGVGEASWRQLARDLEQAHDTDDPPTTANRTVEGWLNCFGVALVSSGASDLERAYRMAAALGFRELTAPEALRERINGSRRRWRAVRRTAHHQNSQEQTTRTLPDGAAPPAPATLGGLARPPEAGPP